MLDWICSLPYLTFTECGTSSHGGFVNIFKSQLPQSTLFLWLAFNKIPIMLFPQHEKINHSDGMIQLLKAGSHSPQFCPSESLTSFQHRVARLLRVKIWVPRLIHSHSVKSLEDVGMNPVNSAEISKGWLSVLLARQTGLDFLPPFVSLGSHVRCYMLNSMLWLHTKDIFAHLWDQIS